MQSPVGQSDFALLDAADANTSEFLREANSEQPRRLNCTQIRSIVNKYNRLIG